MTIKDIKIGTKLEIELINTSGQKIGQTFISQIIDFIDNSNIVISAPMLESKIAFIPINSKVRMILIHDKYGLMSFTGSIASKGKRDNLIEFVITSNSEFEKIQRRNYFRLDCVLDAKYQIIQNKSEDQPSIDTPAVYYKALTRNISGCGACIVTDEAIPKDADIELLITLEPSNSINAICRIVRSAVNELAKGKKYEYGLSYTDISKKDQNSIIKFVFDQQKLLLKKTNLR